MKAAVTVMDNKERKIINKRDAVIVGVISAFAIAGIILPHFFQKSGSAVICCDNRQIAVVSLEKDNVYSFPEAEGMLFSVSDGAISVTQSSCGDHTCVRTGKISRKGQVIVCVPNKVTVTIESNEQNDLDVVLK